ncbi:MAG: RagB/SusD family nutrient uptake outer membrane protein [Phocaeicola sp.]
MKKIFLFLSIFSLGLTSCSDFLDRMPLEELSDASFWKSIDDAEAFTGDIYRSFPSYNMCDTDINSDDLVHGIKWAEGNMARGIYDPSGFGWGTEYTAIRKCNFALQKIELVTSATQEERDLVIAEARALRGYFYFLLMQRYGDVPYTDEPLDLDQLLLERTPIAEVYAKTKADLEFAADKLPVTQSSTRYGRLTKGAALTILMDMQNYFASFPATSGGLTYGFVTYAEAAATAKKIIDLGVYELWDENNATGNYEELFWEGSDRHAEMIMCRRYKVDVANNGQLGWGSFPTVGWGGVNPTQSLVDAFEDIEGAPLTRSTLYNEEDPFKNRDPRLAVNVLANGDYLPGWDMTVYTVPMLPDGGSTYPTGIGTHGDATATGYNQKKYLDQTVTTNYVGAWRGDKDLTIYRFAEVLLVYAEAVTEDKKTITSEAMDAVNRVRRRVGMPEIQTSNPSLPTYIASVEDLRQRIRNEYRVELAIEGKRFWSIRRFRDNNQEIALKVMNEPILGMKWDADAKLPYQGTNIICRSSAYESANVRYPIPQAQIDLNPNLTQNEGYR